MANGKPGAAAVVTPLVRASTLTEAAFERLAGLVVSGVWKEGERIPPGRELCQQLLAWRGPLCGKR
ncbi:MAG: hypothetical protein HYX27_15010 [Acidobacteria bacterium]|nr:hypothetical protein [Acidobacteriota bacterium]